MSGTIRGRIECAIAAADEFLCAGEYFKNVYDVLSGHPLATVVSLGYGSGGTGMGYPNDPGALSDNAHFVVRMDASARRSFPFYIFVTVGGVNTAVAESVTVLQQSAPTSGSGQVMISAAVGIGGDENPYNGTQNADGTDTKPTQIWDVPTGGTNVLALGARNSTLGTDGVNKNNVQPLYSQSQPSQDCRQHIVCDDDTFIFFWDDNYPSGVFEMTVLGCPVTLNDLTYPRPLYLFSNGATAFFTGNFSNWNSGITAIDTAEDQFEAGSLLVASYDDVLASAYQPDADGGRDLLPVYFGSYDSNDGAADRGLRSQSELLKAVYGVASEDTINSLEYFVIGNSSTTSRKYVVPWDGATTPGSGFDRSGTDFTRAP